MFPEKDPITALIFTYAIIPLGMVARPLGSIVFGYLGDVYGRERALFITLIGMACISGCMAFIPTYGQIGLLAPILFALARALQNFFAAGETMGGAIFLLENTSEKRHDVLSGLYGSSTMGGHLLASFGVAILSFYHVIDAGWRFLYLCGSVTAIFACLLRLPQKKGEALSSPAVNFKNALWTHRKPLFSIILTSGFASATYSMALVLMNGLIPMVSTLSKADVMQINTYLLIFDFCALPFFGFVASKMAREKLMLVASLGALLFAIPLLASLEGASILTVIGVRICLVIFGVAFFAPFHAWAQQLIHPSCRYAVISIGYVIGAQVLGSPTAAVSLWCFQKTGTLSSVAWYWMLLALASSVAIVMGKKSQVAERA
jgi:MHS family proline/betaine transporter-like MFS transporter